MMLKRVVSEYGKKSYVKALTQLLANEGLREVGLAKTM